MKTSKKIIFTADDFGKCDEMDLAIQNGFETGVLTNTCIMSNGENYQKAMQEIIPILKPYISSGGLGFHFNIIEGKSLLDKKNGSMLCDEDGNYNKSYFYMMLNSMSKDFLEEVEAEFRSQIERMLTDLKAYGFNIDHVNSHVHVHAIPSIFDMTCRLANEYGINCIRTQYERFYFVSIKKYFEMSVVSVCLNLAKNLLLKFFTLINNKTLKKYNIKSNNKFVGLLFTGFMDEESIEKGLKTLTDYEETVEVLVHPYKYISTEKIDKNKDKEFKIVSNNKIRTILEKKGWNFINFSRLKQ